MNLIKTLVLPISAATFVLILPMLAAAQNHPPIVDAGPSQTIILGDPAMLHGTATDPDGHPIMMWQWEITSAPAGSNTSLSGSQTPDAIFNTDTLGNYVITLVASDGLAWSEPDATVVSVVSNQPPTAVAGAIPLNGTVPLTVTFDATASSDPEGSALSFNWNFGDGTIGIGATIDHTFTAIGEYSVVLVVTDNSGLTDFDTVVITVNPPNAPPTVAPSSTPASGPAPLTVQFFAGALDAEGAPLTYAWDFADPQSPDNTSTLANPFHTYWSMGTYIAWVTVSDGVNEVSDSVVIVVDSRPPLLTTSAMVDLSTDAHKFKGTVTYAAFVDLTPPSSHDIISLEFDGNRIFTAPFSAFSPGLYPDTYVLVKRRLLVQIDLAENLLFVDAGRANLVKFDNTNGVDVVLSWGDEVGVDQFVMTQLNPIIWSYNR